MCSKQGISVFLGCDQMCVLSISSGKSRPGMLNRAFSKVAQLCAHGGVILSKSNRDYYQLKVTYVVCRMVNAP